ncbi:MAG TPA: DegT/DnrJ/EryC1/StrS family aminotransferase [Candidatus Methylomirabilis sp.]|nr:DegT/DnrJ/EryC1/StrS family aminotransferase [Candidatus Methylomirabilis sp.]
MIPVNEPLLDGREKELLVQCIDTGWISSDGPFIKEFEEKFSDYIGVKHGVSVCNGTAALEAALYGTGIQNGDEIIMPSFTIISCAIAALRLGAKPVLLDIEPETWSMDVTQIKSKITKKTKAIMPVHIYGHPVNMDPVFEVAEKYNLKIVEDAAEVHGAQYYSKIRGNKWLKCGCMGDAAAFSFYANKIITTGEGGMVLTDDPIIAERAASYRNLCFKPEKRFYHTELGYNFRMTNLQAAIGIAQLERIDEFISIKRSLGEYYRKRFSTIPGVRFQVEKPYARSVYWMYSIELHESSGIDAESMIMELKNRGIGTRPFFMGLHAQPVLKDMGLFKNEKYPNTEKAYKQGLYLPSGLTLTTSQIDTVSDAVEEIMKKGDL